MEADPPNNDRLRAPATHAGSIWVPADMQRRPNTEICYKTALYPISCSADWRLSAVIIGINADSRGAAKARSLTRGWRRQ